MSAPTYKNGVCVGRTLALIRYLAKPRRYAEIQEETGCSRRTAMRWIAELRDAVRPEFWAESTDEHGRRRFQIVEVELHWIEPISDPTVRGGGWA